MRYFPYWIHIEPCVSPRSQPSGRLWKIFGSCNLLPERCGLGSGRACLLRPVSLEVNLLSYGKGIIHFDAEISDRAFDLGMTEQELDGAEVAGATVDQGCLGTA